MAVCGYVKVSPINKVRLKYQGPGKVYSMLVQVQTGMDGTMTFFIKKIGMGQKFF